MKGYYVRQALTLPPHVTWRKARRKVGNRLKRDVGRVRARLLGTDVSNGDFLRALDSRFPTIQAFLDSLATRRGPRFFVDADRRRARVSAIRDCCSDAEALTTAAADRVCEHIFDLLGSGPKHLGEQIDWYRDFKSGYRWDPRTYYAGVRYNLDIGHDIKVPWELSRCQHFAWLGQAYLFTGDEKHALEFTAQVTDWIEHNPPQFGVNWKCTMDVAIRVVNWLWGYYFFRDSPSLTREFRLQFFKSLLAHGRHIISNLEVGDLTSNHYLSDLVGLVYLGIMLPEFKEAQRWREKGLSELWSEMGKQVYPDGADFEASTSYHRLVTELFLSPIILCQLNGIPVPDEVMERLEKMLEFVMHYNKPDGTVPLIGDADNGRLHRLNTWADPEREWVDHRYLLAIGAVLFEREDFAWAAGDQWEEAFWLLGQRPVLSYVEGAIAFKEQFDKKDLPPLRLGSRAFPHAGIHVMRHDDLYMIVDAGPNGQNCNGGHAHNDTLSFELCAYDKTFICDPGAYVYTADYRWRNTFRSTAYHNTIVVDGQEMNRFDERQLFRMRNDAIPEVHRWEVSDEYDVFDGEHSGYERLPNPVTHRRQVHFDKAEGFWIVRDSLTGRGEHRFDLYFHFAPMKLINDEGDSLTVRTDCEEGANLAVVPLQRDGLSVEISEGWVSYSYGTKVEAPIVKYSKVAEVPTEFVTILFPSKEQKMVKEIEEIAGPLLGRLK